MKKITFENICEEMTLGDVYDMLRAGLEVGFLLRGEDGEFYTTGKCEKFCERHNIEIEQMDIW